MNIPLHASPRQANPMIQPVRFNLNMNTVIFKIDGMHCDGCAQTIKALISAEPGGRAAGVSFEDGQVRILYDPRTISEDRLVKVIARGGYRVPGRKT